MHRLYSSDSDGRSFNRIEWSLLGYDGPSLLVIKTSKNEIIGAFAHGTWKDSINYHGCSDCFLFQLQPQFKILSATGEGDRFMYMHSSERHAPLHPALEGLPKGIGFGGSIAEKPRLFIPDSLEHCSVSFVDKTYQSGGVLPDEDLDHFEISCLEVWGVGDEIMVQYALKKRDEYRLYQAEFLQKARRVEDKTQFVEDLSSGMIMNNLYKHRDEARGRHDFAVDDAHGGYKIELK
jgi:hypothetical protein